MKQNDSRKWRHKQGPGPGLEEFECSLYGSARTEHRNDGVARHRNDGVARHFAREMQAETTGLRLLDKLGGGDVTTNAPEDGHPRESVVSWSMARGGTPV